MKTLVGGSYFPSGPLQYFRKVSSAVNSNFITSASSIDLLGIVNLPGCMI